MDQEVADKIRYGRLANQLQSVNRIGPVRQHSIPTKSNYPYYFIMLSGYKRVTIPARSEFEAVALRAIFLERLIELKGAPVVDVTGGPNAMAQWFRE